MADTNVMPMPERRPLPDRIEVDPNAADMGMTPRELRELKNASGLRLDYLMGDECDLDEKAQLGTFIALRRAGYDPTWDEALDVLAVPKAGTPDPTSGAS